MIRHLLILLSLCGQSAALSAQSLPRQLDDLMSRLLREHDVPGATLAVTKDGRLVYAKGFGYADSEAREAMRPQHLFRIGSVSKPIAAVAVLKLVEQGRLRLSDRVYRLVGEVPLPAGATVNPAIDAITIEDLLRHSSGQAIYNASGRISSPMQPPVSRDISRLFSIAHPPPFAYVVGYMKTRPLLHTAGKRFKYSNYGYALLGLVVEKVTSMPFDAYVKKTILAPVGIHCMQFGATLKSQKKVNEVTYYDLAGRPPVRSVLAGEPPGPFPYAGRHHEGWGAAGAWIASTVDIVRFVNHVDGQRSPAILRAATVRRMLARQDFPEHDREGFWYGLGWRVQKKRSGHHWYHNGSSNSGSAAIMLRTADGIAWAAHFNRRLPAGRALYEAFNREMWRIVRSVDSWPRHDLFRRDDAC
ncbi:serine hydrolase domain-containing protein [Exilibacterium tricleocarpae]|nr:serine hydrolase domain-containing protein [Exilibacterium tricleocarpae]